VGTLIIAELFSYFWHRIAAHTPEVIGIFDTHKYHHKEPLTHQAHEDFFWIFILLIFFTLFCYYVYLAKYIKLNYLIIIYVTILFSFIWTWYIHSCYHVKNHWLNDYEWFKKDKKLHFQHHKDPETNYGIATHFSDIIFDTYHF